MTARTARSPLVWLGGLLAVYLTVPLIAFFVRFGHSDQRGFGTPGLWSALRTSVESATIATLIIAVFGIPLAHALVRHRGRGASVVGMAVQLPLALPPVMSGILLIYLVGPYTTIGRFFHGRLTNSVAGVVIAQVFVAAPFLVIAARSAFASVDPSLDDLAATLGHHPLIRFFKVNLAAAAPGIRAGLLLTWLRAIGEYGANVVVAYHPYSLPVFTYVQFSGSGIPTTQAPTVLVLVAAAAALLVSQMRRPAWLSPSVAIPEPRPPQIRRPTPVAFDIDVNVGTFRVRIGHRASSHRLAILGPSGSGKSVTLRALAGLLGPRAGEVRFAGTPVETVAPEWREVGYVPQSLGLFPNRTVWQQLMFAAGADPAVAAWWLETLGISELRDRFPDQLSGGQRQRVSLAQALAREPGLILLDEPFSALDAPVRDELRRELRRLQRDAGLSTVLVTHDPEEAALLADEILVISAGRLLQAGPAPAVYRHPASPQVARLLGIQNIVAGTVAGDGLIAAGAMTIPADTRGLAAGTAVRWCVRAEHVEVLDPLPVWSGNGGGRSAGASRRWGGAGEGRSGEWAGAGSGSDGEGGGAGGSGEWAGGGAGSGAPGAEYGEADADVIDAADLGAVTSLTVRPAGGPELRVRTPIALGLSAGDRCAIRVPAERITVWPAQDKDPALGDTPLLPDPAKSKC